MTEPSKSRARKAGKRLAKWSLGELDLFDDEIRVEIAVVQGWRQQHDAPLALTTPELRRWVVAEAGSRSTLVAQRMKQLPTIVEKLGRHPGMSLDRMQDIAGCRGVVPTSDAIDRIAANAHGTLPVVGDDDYRRDGKQGTGYRARHLVVVQAERLVEIQLRTTQQHRWAESVASTGERLGYALKDGRGPADLLEYFKAASDMLWLQEEGLDMTATQQKHLDELRESVRPYFART